MNTLDIIIAPNSVYESLPCALCDALDKLARLTWADDMNVGTGANNGNNFIAAWQDADDYLRRHGMSNEYRN